MTVKPHPAYYGNHTNCSLNNQTALTPMPRQGPPHSVWNPQVPKQKWQAIQLDWTGGAQALHLMWQTSCPLGTSGTSLRKLIYRNQAWNSKNTWNRGQCVGWRAEWWSGHSSFPVPTSSGLLFWVLVWGKNAASRVFPRCPTITHTHNKPNLCHSATGTRPCGGTSQLMSECLASRLKVILHRATETI